MQRLCVIFAGALCLGAAPTLTFAPVPDGQPMGRGVPVGILADEEAVQVDLLYRPTGAANFDEAPMFEVGGGFWTADIPAATVTSPAVEYFVRARDAASAQSSVPSEGASAPHTFTVESEDGAGPQLIHVPIAEPWPEHATIPISAFAADSSFVGEVRVHYRAPGGGFTSAVLFKLGGGRIGGEIPAEAALPPVVEYYLEAQDARLVPNRTTVPAEGAAGPLAITIDQPGAPTITHTPIEGAQDARMPLRIEATVVDDVAITEAWVFYRGATETAFTNAVALNPIGGDVRAGEIPASAVLEPEVVYYLEVADADGHITRHPDDAPRSAHAVAIVNRNPGDSTAPEILHEPVVDGQPWRTPVQIEADVRDASGVFAVRLNVALVDSSTITPLQMIRGNGDRFTAEIPSNLVRGRGVRYFIVAIDASPNANRAADPSQAPDVWFEFSVTGDPNVPDPNEEVADLYVGNGCGCGAAPYKPRAQTAWWPLLLGCAWIVRRGT